MAEAIIWTPPRGAADPQCPFSALHCRADFKRKVERKKYILSCAVIALDMAAVNNHYLMKLIPKYVCEENARNTINEILNCHRKGRENRFPVEINTFP